MKREETFALKYLKSLNYSDIIYEPDGNIPPDFLINGQLAVEVRRLNQYVKIKNKVVPLEELEFKLIPKISKLLSTFGKGHGGKNAFVNVKYERPIFVDGKLMNKIKNILNEHLMFINYSKNYQITDNLLIEIIPWENDLEYRYNFGSISDLNGGGFVLSNITKSLNLIIQEKENKIKKYYNKYKTWWLVLIDYIGYGVATNETEILKKDPRLFKIFEKIVFVAPLRPFKGISINYNGLSK